MVYLHSVNMLDTLLYIVLPAGVVASCLYYKDKVVNFLKQARYELIYWALGTLAVGDDMLWGWKNKLKGKKFNYYGF